MKHLEESHKYMEEDEDYEIDMEIARELAAEKRALEEAAERKHREEELRVGRLRKRLLTKVSSLPANFTFNFTDQVVSPTTAGSGLGSKRGHKPRPVIMIDTADGGLDIKDSIDNIQSAGLDSINFCLSPTLVKMGDNSTRKYSDVTIMDEESANLTQYLVPSYPEFLEPDEASLDSLSWAGECEEAGDSMASSLSTDSGQPSDNSWPQLTI